MKEYERGKPKLRWYEETTRDRKRQKATERNLKTEKVELVRGDIKRQKNTESYQEKPIDGESFCGMRR